MGKLDISEEIYQKIDGRNLSLTLNLGKQIQ